MPNELIDNYGRKHDYLRISVTDRCNLRCVYCMGPEGVPLLDHDRILRYEEIVRIVAAAAELGITKIRLTGGEPLVRKGIEKLVRDIAGIPGIIDIALTTNGVLLAEKAQALKEAGLQRVNISLDSLQSDVYRKITRMGELADALKGIKAALEIGLSPVKLNVVLMQGVNENEISDFLRLPMEYPLHLRFIEYMPIDSHDREWRGRYLPLQVVKEQAALMGLPLEPVETIKGAGPSETFSMPGALGTVGLIHAISSHFCAECNRLRLTPDGFIKPCLYWQEELSLKPVINDREGIKAVLKKALQYKRNKHEMDNMSKQNQHKGQRGMSMIGG